MFVRLLEAQIGIPNEAWIGCPLAVDETVPTFAVLLGFRLVPRLLHELAKLAPSDLVTAESEWFGDPGNEEKYEALWY